MYMREMGTVELFTCEGEIDIAKRIEDGSTRFNAPLLNIRKRSPICWNSTIVLKQKKRVRPIRSPALLTRTQKKIWHLPPLTSVLKLSQEDLDDDEDEDEEDGDDDSADDANSIDPELAGKFAELRAQYVVTRDTIKAKGRSHAAAQEEILKPLKVFRQFRLVPKQFDYLVNSMRVMMDRVRTQERLIMKSGVEQWTVEKSLHYPVYRQRNQRYLVQRGNCDEQAVVGKLHDVSEEVTAWEKPQEDPRETA